MPPNQMTFQTNSFPMEAITLETAEISALKLKIELEPKQLVYRYQLVNLLRQQGANDIAHEHIHNILAIDPTDLFALVNLGYLLTQKNLKAEAIEVYESAIKHSFLNIKTLKNKLSKFKARQLTSQATAIKQRMKDIEDLIVISYSNCGSLYFDLGHRKNGIDNLKRALDINPDFEDANINMGVIYEESGNPLKALNSFEKVLHKNPNHKIAHLGKANALKEMREFDKAIPEFQKAISLDPNYTDAIINLSTCYLELGHPLEAIDYLNRVAQYDPHCTKLWSNMGAAYSDLGRTDEADSYYDKAIQIDANNPLIVRNKAFSLLKGYRFKDGLAYYDHRWMTSEFLDYFLVTDKPVWNLQEGHRVFLWAEQGIGDEVMFGTMISEVLPLCSEVIVQADSRLHSLFQRSFNDKIRLISRTETLPETEYDYHLPLGSLMNFFLQPDDRLDIPQTPYLVPDIERAKRIRNEILGNKTDQLIGMSWKTQSTNKGIPRSLDLNTFFKHVSTENRIFVNLQYGDVDSEIKNLFNTSGIRLVQYHEIDNFSDIEGLAALIAACDGVISATNATIDLTAAQGKPCQVLIPAASDWRWGVNATHSYWYKSAQFHRNTLGGDWSLALKSASDAARLSVEII